VKMMCRVLCVSESGYSAWHKRVPSQRQLENERLTEQIQHAHEQGRQVYGSPRIHAELRAQGIRCGKHRVARLMRQAGLRAVQKQRRVRTTNSRHSDPVAPNLLQCDFTAPAPNRKWLTDIPEEADGSLRLVYAASIRSCRPCELREQCQWQGGTTKKPRQVSVLLHPLAVGNAPILWRDWSRRSYRRACMQLLRHQRVEVQEEQRFSANLDCAPAPLSHGTACTFSPRLGDATRSQRTNPNSEPGNDPTLRSARSVCRCSWSSQEVGKPRSGSSEIKGACSFEGTSTRWRSCVAWSVVRNTIPCIPRACAAAT